MAGILRQFIRTGRISEMVQKSPNRTPRMLDEWRATFDSYPGSKILVKSMENGVGLGVGGVHGGLLGSGRAEERKSERTEER